MPTLFILFMWGEQFKPTKPMRLVMSTRGVGYGHKGGRIPGMLGQSSTIEPGEITKVAMFHLNLAWV